MTFESRDCIDIGVWEGEGVGVGVIRGEGLGVGVGVTREDTFQTHVRISVPFSLLVIADTFHMPTAGLVFV